MNQNNDNWVMKSAKFLAMLWLGEEADNFSISRGRSYKTCAFHNFAQGGNRQFLQYKEPSSSI